MFRNRGALPHKKRKWFSFSNSLAQLHQISSPSTLTLQNRRHTHRSTETCSQRNWAGSEKAEKKKHGLQKQRVHRRRDCLFFFIKWGLAFCHHVHHWSPSRCSRQGRLCLFWNILHRLCGERIRWVLLIFVVVSMCFWKWRISQNSFWVFNILRYCIWVLLFWGICIWVHILLDWLWWSYRLGWMGSIWSGFYCYVGFSVHFLWIFLWVFLISFSLRKGEP